MKSPRRANLFVAVALFFKNIVNFKGRSTRSEFWWPKLPIHLVIWLLLLRGYPAMTTVWVVLMLLPSVSCAVRRLHDAGYMGIDYLYILIPVVGWIIVLVKVLKKSAPANEWGEPAEGTVKES